jgi:hypothetical protein
VLGLPFGSGMRLCPREELVQIEAKIGSDSRPGITHFLNNGVFHN